jgi:hypothetical protein
MTVSVTFHHVKNAVSKSYTNPDGFDTVEVFEKDGSYVTFFLPHGTGQAVADAINAAITTKGKSQ